MAEPAVTYIGKYAESDVEDHIFHFELLQTCFANFAKLWKSSRIASSDDGYCIFTLADDM